MAGEDKDLKKWGTIFLGSEREATVSELDAMQAAARQEQWNKKTEKLYMDKVREKATERAKGILGEAYTERQSILEETRQLAQSMQQQAQQELDKAEAIKAQAQQELSKADAIVREAEERKANAQQDGYNAGIEQAGVELAQFRNAMGTSVAGVLGEIHRQCDAIFQGWRDEMVELMRVCVEKCTGVVLTLEHEQILRTAIVEAIRQLDDRRIITLRVNPEDEPAIGDLITAAKESIPDIGQWAVMADASMQAGGIVAEGRSGTVDSRMELHAQLVSDILQNLGLPPTSLDAEASAAVEQALQQEQARIMEMAGPAPDMPTAPDPTVDAACAAPAMEDSAAHAAAPEQAAPDAVADAMPDGIPDAAPNAMPHAMPDASPAQEAPASFAADVAAAQGIDFDALQAETADLLAQQSGPVDVQDLLGGQAPMNEQDILAAQEMLDGQALDDPLGADSLSTDPLNAAPMPEAPNEADAASQSVPDPAQAVAEPTREELEEELLPIPDEADLPSNPQEVDEALAHGGFLDQPGTADGAGS